MLGYVVAQGAYGAEGTDARRHGALRCKRDFGSFIGKRTLDVDDDTDQSEGIQDALAAEQRRIGCQFRDGNSVLLAVIPKDVHDDLLYLFFVHNGVGVVNWIW